MFNVSVIADSISPDPEGVRLTTMQLAYPRYIHAEMLTHRVFSRNASSSRAIPVPKLAEKALSEMVEPVRYGLNKPGMQASEENLTGENLERAKAIWKKMAKVCAEGAQELSTLGLHKQWANRPMEWFTNIHVIVTATDWSNFFHLRAHPDAQPEIRVLAEAMLKAQDKSTPTKLRTGEWHLPYVSSNELLQIGLENAKKCSTARCARVSYLTHDGKEPSLEKDLELFDRLVGSQPIHASPTEHQATPDIWNGTLSTDFGDVDMWDSMPLHGNLYGWIQHRKLIERDFNS